MESPRLLGHSSYLGAGVSSSALPTSSWVIENEIKTGAAVFPVKRLQALLNQGQNTHWLLDEYMRHFTHFLYNAFLIRQVYCRTPCHSILAWKSLTGANPK